MGTISPGSVFNGLPERTVEKSSGVFHESNPIAMIESRPDQSLEYRATPKPQDQRGLPLGWRLGISTSIIVVVVLGILATVQIRRDIRREWESRHEMLSESLAPLAYKLEQAETQEQVERELSAYIREYQRQERNDHHVEIRDQEGNLVAAPPIDYSVIEGASEWILQAQVSIDCPALPQGRGTLIGWQDGSDYALQIEQRWRLWVIVIILTTLSIIISLQVSYHYLVAKPLNRLLQGVRHIEMGYWDELHLTSGAWEIRWLAQRLEQMGVQLEDTVRRLALAERRGRSKTVQPQGNGAPRNGTFTVGASSGAKQSSQSPTQQPVKKSLETEDYRLLRLDELWARCRTLERSDKTAKETIKLAREVWERDVFEAEYCGDIRLKIALENLALKILEPATYAYLEKELAAITESRTEWLKQREAEIRAELDELRIPYLDIRYRTKHLAGIRRKMESKALSLKQVQDIFAFRIIVFEEQHCYQALDMLHALYEPIWFRFKDYIAAPKANGYQSIHTTVRYQDGIAFEVQIRTHDMHKQADQGSASHWSYKVEQSTPENERN